MRFTSRSIFSVITGLLVLTSSLALAAEQAVMALPSARLVTVEGAAKTYRLTDYDGRAITAVVPSQSVVDIQGRSADGTVRATLAAIDTRANQVRVVTQKGQTLVLALEPGVMQTLRVGTPVEVIIR